MKNDSFCTRSKAPTRQHDDSKSHSAVWDSFSVLSRFDIAASMATLYQVSILFWILPKTDPIWIILDSTPTISFFFVSSLCCWKNKKYQVERENLPIWHCCKNGVYLVGVPTTSYGWFSKAWFSSTLLDTWSYLKRFYIFEILA